MSHPPLDAGALTAGHLGDTNGATIAALLQNLVPALMAGHGTFEDSYTMAVDIMHVKKTFKNKLFICR